MDDRPRMREQMTRCYDADHLFEFYASRCVRQRVAENVWRPVELRDRNGSSISCDPACERVLGKVKPLVEVDVGVCAETRRITTTDRAIACSTFNKERRALLEELQFRLGRS